MRVLRKGLITLISLPVLYLLIAGAGGVISGGTNQIPPKTGADVAIRLVRGPIHTDILIPIKAATLTLGWLRDQQIAMDHPNAEWLVIGWGARGFYTQTQQYKDIQARTIWRAITGDSAVLRVDIAGARPPDPDAELHLSAAEFQQLTLAITDSFANAHATPPLDLPGFTANDRFFPAKGDFSLFNTCNVWIGRTLRAAGVRFGIWTPTPYSIRLSNWRFRS